jgi:nucleotide-binding universal stress UspA family protein
MRSHTTEYLTLDELTVDPALAQRLSADLAWRYHALPLTEDHGRVTVAMADPDDTEARQAVVAVLGPGSCVVRGSSLTIDVRLAEIWGNEARRPFELRVGTFPEPLPDEVWDYTQALVALLGAQVKRMSVANAAHDPATAVPNVYCDLVVFGERNHPLIRDRLSRPGAGSALGTEQRLVPFAILVAQEPRWPLERILLLVCGETADNAAVEWAVRLAGSSAATVTALAVVPPMPSMYRGLASMEPDLAALLATDTALGMHLRQVARRMSECRIDGTLRLRQGLPEHQIARELTDGEYDLVVVATTPCRWWLRQLKGDPLCSVLSWVDRPLLLAEPTNA